MVTTKELSPGEPAQARLAFAKQRSYVEIVVQQFVKNRAATIGFFFILFVSLIALGGSSIAPYEYSVINLAERLKGPSAAHWSGTDELGRDVLSRVIIGARITLLITVAAVGLALASGCFMGVLAGYLGGYVDSLASRFTDILMAMPSFLLAIGVVAVLGVDTLNVIIAVGIASIPSFIRVARASTFLIKAEDYILAARAVGASTPRIMSRHILPNIAPPLIVQTSLRLATAILAASSLSFLGLGPQPPTPEWGAMLSTASNFISSAPYLGLFPGLAILLVTLSFNVMGDGLRDALDPRVKH